MILVGVDTGGTFTDFVVWHEGRLITHKVLSTPSAPERAILEGIRDLGLDSQVLRLIHGSTVATNAVLEGKGVRTAYVTNRGLADLLNIGRQARPDLYALQPSPRAPLTPRELCIETGGRLGADGHWVEPLSEEDLRSVIEAIARSAPEAVAINLLFSYLNEDAERAIEAAIPLGIFVARSSEVLPLSGEYERGIATWINARIGPLVAYYLERLVVGLPSARIAVMQSSGEAVSAAQASRHTARLLLSGPAGGLAGAAFAAGAANQGPARLLTFDMGGTSTDVALIEGEPRLTNQTQIAGLPIALPMVEMHTIGAGGGSLARLDAGGMLRVGPESAGADPGPACYGRGGTEPTVTDANLVLGRLDPECFLGGRMRLDLDSARAALGTLARAMDLSPEETALGVVRLADEHMARALLAISVQRGKDPRDFVMTSFGGAGGLHVCALADALGMTSAMVPAHAGVLSALGMTVSPAGRTLTRTWWIPLADAGDQRITRALGELAESGREELVREGVPHDRIRIEGSLDLRYQGQSHTLNAPWQSVRACAEEFHRMHEAIYGHRLDLPLELVNLRVRLRGPTPHLALPALAPDPSRLSAPTRATTTGSVESATAAHMQAPERAGTEALHAARRIQVYGYPGLVPSLPRTALARDQTLTGPAIITDALATTWLAPGWRARLDPVGNLLLERTGSRVS